MAKTTKRRRRPATGRRKPASTGRGTMWPWYAAGVAVVAGIFLFDARPPGQDASVRTASIERAAKPERRTRDVARKVVAVEPARDIPLPGSRPSEAITEQGDLPVFTGKWFICTTQKDYCVLTGDTVLYAGRKVRLADIDAPAIAEARCDAERLLGGDAKLRLREILSEGDIKVASADGVAGTRKGDARVFLRNGRSVGERLVSEGLARQWTGRHSSWCG